LLVVIAASIGCQDRTSEAEKELSSSLEKPSATESGKNRESAHSPWWEEWKRTERKREEIRQVAEERAKREALEASPQWQQEEQARRREAGASRRETEAETNFEKNLSPLKSRVEQRLTLEQQRAVFKLYMEIGMRIFASNPEGNVEDEVVKILANPRMREIMTKYDLTAGDVGYIVIRGTTEGW
jgi:hypothetical protein